MRPSVISTFSLLGTLALASCLSTVKEQDDSFDWRTKGVISQVRNQGAIGSSADFAIAEGVESLHAIVTKTPVQYLSVDEMADCCSTKQHQPKYQGYDCVVAIGGLCSDVSYKRGTGQCQNDTCTAVGKVSKTGYIPEGQEDEMKKTIHYTPLTAYIDASHPSFQMYVGGIYSEPACTPAHLDHLVQVVGYGSEGGVDYWIIKNSWGAAWGENGYMRIARGKNMCGIASKTFYPIN